MIEFLNNLSSANHWEKLVAEFATADEVTILSPFLDDTLLKLAEALPGSLNNLTVVTRLFPDAGAALDTSERLMRLMDWAEQRKSLHLTIRDNQRLHGKIYLVRRAGRFAFAALGSANCTNNGLLLNEEWSVALTDGTHVADLAAQIESTFPRTRVLTRLLLTRIRDEARQLVARNKAAMAGAKTARLRLNMLLLQRTPPPLRQVVPLASGNVWLKPVGDSEQPISTTEDYWTDPHRLHFARKPKGVSQGDLLIAYATGHRKIVGLFEVSGPYAPLSPAELAAWPRGHRWPWAVPGRPLTPNFSRTWSDEELYLREVVKKFQSGNASKSAKEKAGRIIGALQFHSDKVRLGTEFASFLIAELYRRNSEA